jgi:ribosomal protein L7/L12
VTDWLPAIVIGAVVLVIVWAVNRCSAAYYKREINRLEQRADFLYRKLEIDYAQEQRTGLPGLAQELAANGHKIEAIKTYRKATGADLQAAKKAIENMTLPAARPQANWSHFESDPSGLALSPEVQALVRAKQKIQAIKLYREQTGTGLKEAKDAVEAFERDIKRY